MKEKHFSHKPNIPKVIKEEKETLHGSIVKLYENIIYFSVFLLVDCFQCFTITSNSAKKLYT
jgi:hypothetical protein